LLTEHVRINAAASQAYSYCKASQATSSNGHIDSSHPGFDDHRHTGLERVTGCRTHWTLICRKSTFYLWLCDSYQVVKPLKLCSPCLQL
jgi:hypothetical protein